jgi:two-component system, OmpR family, lantibiotic biosynthesis sensor histidine kinase NisK/SpaK
MGNQHIGLIETMPRHRRTSFRRVFVWYCAGILGTTFSLTLLIEFLFLIGFMAAKRTTPINPSEVLWPALSVPFVILTVAILFFAWLMGRNRKN